MAESVASSRRPRGAKKRAASGKGDLASAIAQGIRESLLPGEGPFEEDWVEDAAAFLLETARTRNPGEASVEIASSGEGRRVLRIAVVNDDMPFLVDSLALAISATGLVVDRLVHPVIPVRRDKKGLLTAAAPESDENRLSESMIYIETARVDAKQRRALAQAIETTLTDIRVAVADWPRMVEVMREDAERISDPEGKALLEWLRDDKLTMLGHVTRKRDASHEKLLGVCRRGAMSILAADSYDRACAWFDDALRREDVRAPLVIKANRIATVHRRVPLDLFIVPIIESGKVVALSIHAGIWTSEALGTPPDRVPRLRQQLSMLAGRLGFDPRGHTGKSITHALTSLPHDLVVSFSDDDVERVATAMTSLVDRPRPRLVLVEAPLARHLLAFVWLPRDMLSTQMRLKIQSMIENQVGAPAIDWSLQVEAGTLALLRYVIDIREADRIPAESDLDQSLQMMLRGWSEAVEAAIAADGEPGRAAALAARYAESFPMGYRADYGANEAAIDIRHIRRLAGGESEDGGEALNARAWRRAVRLFRLSGDAAERLRLKVYQYEGSLPLSDAVPALENFGFRVLAEIPTSLDGGRIGTIHDFLLELPAGEPGAELLDRTDTIEEAIAAVLNNNAENDVFNRLVISAALDAGEADWLRAFYRYMRQAGSNYTIYTVVDALGRAPEVTRAIVALVRARHDPDFEGSRMEAAEAASDAIRVGLAGVAAINDDRVLRQVRTLVDAILRTNAFAPAAREALAFKFESANIPGLPRPVPWREIFVYSRRVEGIHLRAGPIARGGLRWSDRRDDFRTEILGLMKAQRVKNAVIVPTGAKGGFYPKLLPDPSRDRAAWAAEGQASYEIFIRSLLSVTDNIVKDKIVHPARVVIHDGEDPYFVVAADKGTAKFSDIANGIAESRDFWLDDAFASGGSHGYDHKAMGITARGAWISVQRHFLEMGVDVQSEPVRVAGCGDMSGDVFGNGMLLSRAIKLVAAFDHRHIFIDPDPDPATSWAERDRLFALPHSSWDDYDKTLISNGGGVFARTMKRIPLSDEMRALLGTDAAELEPETLISAILKAQIDLIWFGGIGTYIKASTENNATVGDPTNDPIRVDAAEVRARVIGEGANLGVTQAGRIEFSQRGGLLGSGGGRINTDFIDNSAGVDCSDNEVNIKIALAAARRGGKLSEKRRNELLVEMTDEVAELVLDDNRMQALALSIAERGGAAAMPSHMRLIDMLEESGNLDRRTEGLAENEALARRAVDSRGLTRPELAVLLSSTKLMLQNAIENSELPDDPELVGLLLAAFPTPMQAQFRKQIESHRLRREIIATKLANRIVNRLGIVHPFELAEEAGADLAQVAAAFTLADRLFGLHAIWEHLEIAPTSEMARLELFEKLAHITRSHMADLLRVGAGRVVPSELQKRLEKGIAALSTGTQEMLGDSARSHSAKLREQMVATGAPEDVCASVVHLFDLDGAVGIADLATTTGIGPRQVVAAFTRLGSGLGLDWAQTTSALMEPSDPWERLLVAGLARDFQEMRLDFLRSLAKVRGAKADPVGAVEVWGQRNKAAIGTFRAMVHRAEAAVPVTPAMLAQIASQARHLLAR